MWLFPERNEAMLVLLIRLLKKKKNTKIHCCFSITSASITWPNTGKTQGRNRDVRFVSHSRFCFRFSCLLMVLIHFRVCCCRSWFAMAFPTFLLCKELGTGMRAGTPVPSVIRRCSHGLHNRVWFTPHLLCCDARDYCGVRFRTGAHCDVFLANPDRCGFTRTFSQHAAVFWLVFLYSVSPKVMTCFCFWFFWVCFFFFFVGPMRRCTIQSPLVRPAPNDAVTVWGFFFFVP